MCTVWTAFTSTKKVAGLITFLSHLADTYSLYKKSSIFNVSLFFLTKIRRYLCKLYKQNTITKYNFPYQCDRIFLYSSFTTTYSGADKSLARPTSLSILFDGENIF